MRKRILSLFLILCMAFSFAATGFATEVPDRFSDASDAREGILNYYLNEKPQLTHWEELVALKTAGADLTKFRLPETTSVNDGSAVADIANAILCERMKGFDAAELVDTLLAKQSSTGSGKFSALCNEQCWAMIALRAAGADYNGAEAAKYLLDEMQLSDGGFTSYLDSEVDMTAAAAVAISPYLSDEALGADPYPLKIAKMKEFLKDVQEPDGSFSSYGAKNASSTASAIWGLLALGEGAEDPGRIDSAADALLGFLTKEDTGDAVYGYAYAYDWSNWPDYTPVPDRFDEIYTRQALIALTDIASRESDAGWDGVYKDLSRYSDGCQYRTVTVRAGSFDEDLINDRLTAKSAANLPLTAKDALTQAFEADGETIAFDGQSVSEAGGVAPGEGEEWTLFVNGEKKGLDYRPQDDDRLELLLAKTGDDGYYASFDFDTVTDKVLGQNITLTLSCESIAGGQTVKKQGIDILVNGSIYGGYPSSTDSDGKITLVFYQAGTYEISARLPQNETSYSITRPLCTIIIPQGEADSKTVGVRVEGIYANVVDERDFSAQTTGDRLLTVSDAVKQALEQNGKAYAEAGGYFSSIGGEAEKTFGGYDGWMYLVDGQSPSVGMGSYVLSGGEDIVVYYGDFSTLYPKTALSRQADGSFRLCFTADGYDENWNPTVLPITGAEVTWDGSALPGLTDENGAISIAAESATSDAHSLQLRKNGAYDEGTGLYLPCIVRLPSDYTVGLYRADLRSAPADVPQEISVSSNTAYAGIRVAKGAALPGITATVADGGLSLLIPQGTVATSDDAGWDGEIALPRVEDNVALSGKTVDKTISAGAPGATLHFNKPVRLLIPGGAQKTIAYLDQAGNPVEIDTVLSGDNLSSAEAGLAAADKAEGKAETGGDTAVWTKHLTTFVSYSTAGGEEPDGGDGGAGTDRDTITLSVTGYNGQSLLSATTMELQSGDTPLSVLRRCGLSITVSSGYVKTIEGLSEFDHGGKSGWLYSVNGRFPQAGAGSYTLGDGDAVRWIYTVNGGADVGAPSVSETLAPVLSGEPEEYSEALSKVLTGFKKKSELSEWEIYALYAAGETAEQGQLDLIIEDIREQGGNIRKPTDLAKYVLTIGMAGLDPTDAGGYDLVEKLYRNRNLTMQGVNGPVFALIALNSGYYGVPQDALWTKDKLLSYILAAQNLDGGYSLEKGEKSDTDLTAMALQALAPYRGREDAKAAIDRALSFLSENQRENGGFLSEGVNNSESAAQVVIALTALDIDPLSDPAFIKGSNTALSALYSFMLGDNTFSHEEGGGSDEMATSQAALALAASSRYYAGKPPLYEIRPYYYDDLGNASPWAVEAIISATGDGIVNGTNGCFKPLNSVTRAEFSAMLVRMLGLEALSGGELPFTDVPESVWYLKEVRSAYENGVVTGFGGSFYPDKTITREEMAVMLARALRLESAQSGSAPRDLGAASPWASEGVGAAYASGLMTGSGGAFNPKGTVTREMAATVCARAFAMEKQAV